jgi:hypothetical protein
VPRRDQTEIGRATERPPGAIDLVGSIIDDTRALVGAHIEALRDDMTERLTSLGAALTSTLLAFSIMIVTGLLLGCALATTLVALGLPIWAAFWIVTVAAAGLGAGLVRRAQRKAQTTGEAAGRAAERVKDDIAWISGTASLASQDESRELSAAREP